MAQSLRELLLGAAESSSPEQRQALTEIADSFQRITQDFAAEHGKVKAEIAAKLESARQKMDKAQAIMREAEEKARQLENPVPAEPDWTLGPRLRDELLARRKVAPPPPALDSTGSLAPWAFSPQPVPPAAPTPVSPPVVKARPTQHVAQSLASWLVDAPPVPAQEPPSSSGAPDPSSVVSWMSSSPEPTAPKPAHEDWKEATKQWLAKPRKPGSAPDGKE
jgi:hypothetical protein